MGTLIGMNPGSYVILLEVESAFTETVGALGECHFCKGFYVYVGSALATLESRIHRYFSRLSKKRWHIDYLAQRGKVSEVWVLVGRERQECKLSKKLRGFEGATVPVKKFGSTDCNCESHLIYFKERPPLEQLGLTRFI
jgi:Uri superfamily endonuclease